MYEVDSIEKLEGLYSAASQRSIEKVTETITPLYKQWISNARFMILATACAERTDASPRGDIDNLVQIPDNKTVLVPDWKGNNRLDSLRNIVLNGQVSLMFLIPHCEIVVRVNGKASLSTHPTLLEKFPRHEKLPKTVIVVDVREAYFQCAKALVRSELWDSAGTLPDIPTAGQFLQEQIASFDAESFDAQPKDKLDKEIW